MEQSAKKTVSNVTVISASVEVWVWFSFLLQGNRSAKYYSEDETAEYLFYQK